MHIRVEQQAEGVIFGYFLDFSAAILEKKGIAEYNSKRWITETFAHHTAESKMDGCVMGMYF